MRGRKSFEAENGSTAVARDVPSVSGARTGAGGQVCDRRARDVPRGTGQWSGTGPARSLALGSVRQEIHETVERLIDLCLSLGIPGGEAGGESPPEPWITSQRAAEYADCSPDTVLRAMKREELRYGRVGSDYRTRRSWVDDWMMSQPPHPSQHRETAAAESARLSAGTVRMLREVSKEGK